MSIRKGGHSTPRTCRARQLVRQALGMCGQRLLAAEVRGNEEVALLDVLAGL